jgi:hypothetical protein
MIINEPINISVKNESFVPKRQNNTQQVDRLVWWCVLTTQAPKRLRKEDCKFEDSLGYRTRSYLKQTNKQANRKGILGIY